MVYLKKKRSSSISEKGKKEDILKLILEQMGQKTPSEHFASGAIFDITRNMHSNFEQIVRSNNPSALHEFFSGAYMMFCNNPQIVGFTPAIVDINKNDTDPRSWNADVFTFSTGEAITLCYMPIQHDTLAARIIGIAIDDDGDRYYYCMLNKDMNVLSDVIQNKAMLGVEKIGEIKGQGSDLMKSFLNCIKKSD